jgi:hypothetical protein
LCRPASPQTGKNGQKLGVQVVNTTASPVESLLSCGDGSFLYAKGVPVSLIEKLEQVKAKLETLNQQCQHNHLLSQNAAPHVLPLLVELTQALIDEASERAKDKS